MPFYKNAFARHLRNKRSKGRMKAAFGSRRAARRSKRTGWAPPY